MIPEVNFDELAISKVKCLKSLLFHYRYFFKHKERMKAVIGEHHLIIIDALERVLRGELKRLIINIAPRYNKTEIAVKMLISHGLALNPSAKFIHLSYADDLALDNSEQIKEIIQSAEYQQLFPDVKVKKDSRAKDKWYTTAGGGVLARAAGGQVTGFGAGKPDETNESLNEFLEDIEIANAKSALDKKRQFGGLICIDDPIKPIDADSDTIRERVNERFDSTIKNRVNSRHTPIIIIMQRLHPNDLSGYLTSENRREKWEVISLPAINEHNNNYGLTAGEALWPYKHTLSELLNMRHDNEVVFERQYMQNPKPKAGLMFPEQELHFYDPQTVDLTDPDFQYLPVDPANEGGDDFAAAVTRLKGDKIYISDVLYNTDGTDINEPAVVQMVLKNKVNFVGVEGVLGWKETANRIREDLYEKGFEGEFRVLHPRTGKHARITNRQSFIRNHIYFRKDWADFPQYAKFMRILTSYLKIQEPGKMNKRDDAPDLMESVAAYYEKNFPQLW